MACKSRKLLLQSMYAGQQGTLTHLSQLFCPHIQVILSDAILLPHLSTINITLYCVTSYFYQHILPVNPIFFSHLSTVPNTFQLSTPYFFQTCQQFPIHFICKFPTSSNPVNFSQRISSVNLILLQNLSDVPNKFHLSTPYYFISSVYPILFHFICLPHTISFHLSTPYYFISSVYPIVFPNLPTVPNIFHLLTPYFFITCQHFPPTFHRSTPVNTQTKAHNKLTPPH